MSSPAFHGQLIVALGRNHGRDHEKKTFFDSRKSLYSLEMRSVSFLLCGQRVATLLPPRVKRSNLFFARRERVRTTKEEIVSLHCTRRREERKERISTLFDFLLRVK